MMYKRIQYNELYTRITEPRDKIQVIVGPRQIGKSTLIAQVLEEYPLPYASYSADDVIVSSSDWLSEIWETQRMKMDALHEQSRLLVIDEVQKIDNWSETVKAQWDRDTREKRNLKVVLLGSSRMLIQKGLTESLAGRFEMTRMSHWTFSEMRDAFGWSPLQYIYFGGYPGAARFITDEKRWRNYVKDSLIEPSISKDVLFDTKINKPQLLRQLFEIGASYSGEILSLTKILGQLQDKGNVTTLAGYLQLLDECGLLGGLQKFSLDVTRKYKSIPKFQTYNNALKNAYSDLRFEDALQDPKTWGRIVESAIGAYLIGQAQICDYQLYYWRERNLEVDYVLIRGKKIIGIEVKSGRRKMNAGLAEFKRIFNPTKTLVVGTDGLSAEEFLSLDLERLFD